MKIFYATSEVPPTPSGMARVYQQLSAGFEARGHSIDLLASERLPRFAFADMRLAPLLPHWPAVRERAARADVVSLHGPVPTFSDYFLLMNRLRGGLPPIVYSHHMDVRFRRATFATDLYARGLRSLMGATAATIVSTRPTAATMPLPLRAKTHIVPYGVEHARVRADVPKARDFTVLFVGQLRPYKGVDILLRAMQGVEGARLRIVGAGYAATEYRALARKLELRDCEFLGRVSDDHLWELYASSHVFVLPSLEMEYFGLVLLEAMASGCVPIASDMPGPADVVSAAGAVVPRGDVATLRTAIEVLRDNPATRERLSEHARERAATYTWQRTVDAYLQLFEEVAATS